MHINSHFNGFSVISIIIIPLIESVYAQNETGVDNEWKSLDILHSLNSDGVFFHFIQYHQLK